ncbi:putative uncharacterized protein TRPC5OS [Microcebus murinus]|uniref:putative uncharacterized protein TRPC5OS n=1 Tax=Microcebus murinus TaxID=30608 RepID=UPI0001771DC7|nr:putative uncharacterized protein TRPC5OS [Microcebus murinus]XP_012605184.1 putative uncharacterized protein TRPC5OS [Microcebus murinus]XP_012605189.1 putative uncharacterized protein TRPC5OS [Microcebus murinus]XP_012605199.1 putative uncharacterized protein TRPC5OS [Microcebus murinus]
MESVSMSIPLLVGGLIDCVAQLVRIAEELLQLMSQEQVPCTEQIEAEASLLEEGSLPDLADLSDLESILIPLDDEDLMFDIDEVMLDIGDVYEDVFSDINDDFKSD